MFMTKTRENALQILVWSGIFPFASPLAQQHLISRSLIDIDSASTVGPHSFLTISHSATDHMVATRMLMYVAWKTRLEIEDPLA